MRHCTGATRAREITHPTDGSLRRGGRFEKLVAVIVKQEVAEVVVPIGPGSTVVVEKAAHCKRCSIDRQVVETHVRMDEHPVRLGELHSLVHREHHACLRDERKIIGDPRESLPHPFSGFRPGWAQGQPVGYIDCANPGVLLGQYRADLGAYPCAQPRIGADMSEHLPRICSTWHAHANIEVTSATLSQNSWCPERASRLQKS